MTIQIKYKYRYKSSASDVTNVRRYINYNYKFLFLTLGNHDPEGGLKIRKIYKKLGMSSNPCSHDLANCHAKEQR